MKYLKLEQVVDLHDEAISLYGGLSGIRDIGSLTSSIECPKMICFGEEMYKGFSQKAAAYFYFIIKNHPFNDANKRTAFISSLVFLAMNDIELDFGGDKLEDLAIETAKGNADITDIAIFFEVLTRKEIVKGGNIGNEKGFV